MNRRSDEHINFGNPDELPISQQQASEIARATFYTKLSDHPCQGYVELDNGIVLVGEDALSKITRDTLVVDGIVPTIFEQRSPDAHPSHGTSYGFSKEGTLHHLDDGIVRVVNSPVLGTCTIIRHGGKATPVATEKCLDILGKIITGKLQTS